MLIADSGGATHHSVMAERGGFPSVLFERCWRLLCFALILIRKDLQQAPF